MSRLTYRTARQRRWLTAAARCGLGVAAWALSISAGVMAQDDSAEAPAERPTWSGAAERAYTAEERALLDEAAAKNAEFEQLYGQGRYADAIVPAEEALAIRKQVLGEQHPHYAGGLNNLALLYVSMSDYARAEPLYRQALEITKQTLGEQHPDYAGGLNNLARLYESMGDYARAAPLYRQALEIRKQVLGEQHPDYARSLNNLGAIYFVMGDYARAEPLYRQALEIRRQVVGEQHPDYATSLNNLALLYVTMGDYARAEPLYRQALEIRRQVLGEQHPQYATSLNGLAVMYGEMGDYARAEPLYLQALEIRKQVLGEQHPDYAGSLHNLAMLYDSMGDFARAEPLYLQALEIKKQVFGEQHPSYAASLNNLAVLYEAKGDSARAEPLYRQALEIVRELVEATAAAQDETGQLAMERRAQAYVDRYVSCLARRADGAAMAYQAVFGWKGALLVRQRAARLATDNPRLAPVIAELGTVVREWSALAAASDPAAKERLKELTAHKARLETELSRGSAAFRAAAAPVDVAGVQAALPAESALVDYFEFWFYEPSKEKPGTVNWRRSLLAFVVRPEGDVQMFDLGEAAPIHAAIETWRRDFGVSPEAQSAGALLRGKLWDPLVEAIGDVELVLVSPDGPLGKLPLAALPGEKPATYLVEDVAIALVPVPRLIPALVADGERRELPRELLVLGGVDYDRRAVAEITAVAAAGPRRPWERGLGAAVAEQEVTAGLSWSFLPGSESEAAYIAGLYQRLMGLPTGSAQIVHLRGAEATEEAFRAAAPECYLLHLATHGFFATEDKLSALATDDVRGYSPGLLSGLVLAGANEPLELPDDPAQLAALPDDGILTAEEIAFMPLGGAQLVVLSACETGLGEVAGGEGLLGVQRAFQVAGARTTIATLWKVSDEATRRIMEEFYRNYLEREMSPLAALRAAQVWALNNPQLVPRGADAPAEDGAPKRLPPRYWAAFTLSGDWR